MKSLGRRCSETASTQGCPSRRVDLKPSARFGTKRLVNFTARAWRNISIDPCHPSGQFNCSRQGPARAPIHKRADMEVSISAQCMETVMTGPAPSLANKGRLSVTPFALITSTWSGSTSKHTDVMQDSPQIRHQIQFGTAHWPSTMNAWLVKVMPSTVPSPGAGSDPTGECVVRPGAARVGWQHKTLRSHWKASI